MLNDQAEFPSTSQTIVKTTSVFSYNWESLNALKQLKIVKPDCFLLSTTAKCSEVKQSVKLELYLYTSAFNLHKGNVVPQ